jgi:hypothetical protein
MAGGPGKTGVWPFIIAISTSTGARSPVCDMTKFVFVTGGVVS